MVSCLQIDRDPEQHSHEASEPHSHVHESHSHHDHSEHTDTHTHSEHDASHSDHLDSHSAHSESHSHSHDDHEHGHDHVHDDRVSSLSVVLDGNVDMDKVNMFLGGLVELNAEDLYRYKGLLAIEGMDERIVFQVSILAWPAFVQCRVASHAKILTIAAQSLSV